MEAITITPDQTPRTARRSPLLTVVTDSELQTFRACPQLHDFRYRQKLRPLLDAKPLAVGSIFHSGMSAGLLTGWLPENVGKAVATRVELQVTAAVAGIDDRVHDWAGKVVAHAKDVDFEKLAAEVEQTASMVKWILAHYFRSTRSDLTSLTLIEVEKRFDVPMLDKRGREVKHLRYQGVRDAVFWDEEYNQIVLAEHKTSGGDPRAIEKRVEMDTQTAGYLHALIQERAQRPFVTVDGREVPQTARVGRVMYNVLRKSQPRPPKVNKNGQVSVAQCDTTPELYAAALAEQINVRKIGVTADQAVFMDTIAKQGDRNFARIEWNRTREDIERWRSDTVVDANRIREAERDPTRRTRSTGHCNMPWSLPCSFRSICLDRDAPELRRTFRIAESVHEEVRAAETDTEATAA